MEQNCDVVEPRSIPSIIHHFQRFFTHTYCGLFVLYNFIAMIVPTLPELQMMQFNLLLQLAAKFSYLVSFLKISNLGYMYVMKTV